MTSMTPPLETAKPAPASKPVVESLEDKWRQLLAMDASTSKDALNPDAKQSPRLAKWSAVRDDAFQAALARTYGLESASTRVHSWLRQSGKEQVVNDALPVAGHAMQALSCPICHEFIMWQTDEDDATRCLAECCGFVYKGRSLAYVVTRELEVQR